jgi:hypothetical protein
MAVDLAELNGPDRVKLSGMRLDPLYRMVFDYPHGWSVALAGEGTESHHLFFAEGRCDGRLSGPIRGANHPSVRTSTG